MATNQERTEFQSRVLTALGANAYQLQELLKYNANKFRLSSLSLPNRFPLDDELFVSVWEDYRFNTEKQRIMDVLKAPFRQLYFPIRKGISQDPEYQSAVRRGELATVYSQATGLEFNQPDEIRLVIHSSPAGKIPVLIIPNREDFENLLRALTMRNEPEPIPRSLGAMTISGFNNWDRIDSYKRQWIESNSDSLANQTIWKQEFRILISNKELYQDRFILVTEGPYSDVGADRVGISENRWRQLSLDIRINHESTHYFTKRMLGSMDNNLLDEIIADYMGLVVANGQFRADWFNHFMGLETYPHYRQGGRLQNYRGDPPLSEGSFQILQSLVIRAARNLERFDENVPIITHSLQTYGERIIRLANLSLEEMASDSFETRYEETVVI